jgi:hypothetical protein
MACFAKRLIGAAAAEPQMATEVLLSEQEVL